MCQLEKHICQVSSFHGGDSWLTVPAFANGIQELFGRGYSSCFILLFYLGVTSKCFCLISISEKTDSLPESVQCNIFLLAWSRSRLKQNRVAFHTTHFNVNLDLFSPPVGEEHGCIQNASRNSAGAAALRHKIEAIRCFLQVLWSCLVWIASSHTSRILLVLSREKEVGAGSQPATWQQQICLMPPLPGNEEFLLTLTFEIPNAKDLNGQPNFERENKFKGQSARGATFTEKLEENRNTEHAASQTHNQ